MCAHLSPRASLSPVVKLRPIRCSDSTTSSSISRLVQIATHTLFVKRFIPDVRDK
jgi:hypothetical protein